MSYYSGRAKINVTAKEVTLTLEAIDEGLAELLHSAKDFTIQTAPSFHSVGTSTVVLVSDKEIELVAKKEEMTLLPVGITALGQGLHLAGASDFVDSEWGDTITEIKITHIDDAVTTSGTISETLYDASSVIVDEVYSLNQLVISGMVFDSPGIYTISVTSSKYTFVIPPITFA